MRTAILLLLFVGGCWFLSGFYLPNTAADDQSAVRAVTPNEDLPTFSTLWGDDQPRAPRPGQRPEATSAERSDSSSRGSTGLTALVVEQLGGLPAGVDDPANDPSVHRRLLGMYSGAVITRARNYYNEPCGTWNASSFESALIDLYEADEESGLASISDLDDRELADMRAALRDLIQTDLFRYHDLSGDLQRLVQDEDGRRPAVLRGRPSCG